MKKISCIQNYVIDKLIEDRKLSTAGLLDAISKVCSTEQFDNVLSILIERSNSIHLNNNKIINNSSTINAQMAEQADAKVLNTFDHWSCGFNSRSEYNKYLKVEQLNYYSSVGLYYLRMYYQKALKSLVQKHMNYLLKIKNLFNIKSI